MRFRKAPSRVPVAPPPWRGIPPKLRHVTRRRDVIRTIAVQYCEHGPRDSAVVPGVLESRNRAGRGCLLISNHQRCDRYGPRCCCFPLRQLAHIHDFCIVTSDLGNPTPYGPWPISRSRLIFRLKGIGQTAQSASGGGLLKLISRYAPDRPDHLFPNQRRTTYTDWA